MRLIYLQKCHVLEHASLIISSSERIAMQCSSSGTARTSCRCSSSTRRGSRSANSWCWHWLEYVSNSCSVLAHPFLGWKFPIFLSLHANQPVIVLWQTKECCVVMVVEACYLFTYLDPLLLWILMHGNTIFAIRPFAFHAHPVTFLATENTNLVTTIGNGNTSIRCL